jgi:hypothetical protein
LVGLGFSVYLTDLVTDLFGYPFYFAYYLAVYFGLVVFCYVLETGFLLGVDIALDMSLWAKLMLCFINKVFIK